MQSSRDFEQFLCFFSRLANIIPSEATGANILSHISKKICHKDKIDPKIKSKRIDNRNFWTSVSNKVDIWLVGVPWKNLRRGAFFQPKYLNFKV